MAVKAPSAVEEDDVSNTVHDFWMEESDGNFPQLYVERFKSICTRMLKICTQINQEKYSK